MRKGRKTRQPATWNVLEFLVENIFLQLHTVDQNVRKTIKDQKEMYIENVYRQFECFKGSTSLDYMDVSLEDKDKKYRYLEIRPPQKKTQPKHVNLEEDGPAHEKI